MDSLNTQLAHVFIKHGPAHPEYQRLQEQGAKLDPKDLPKLLETCVAKNLLRGAKILIAQGARFDPDRLPFLLEHHFETCGLTGFIYFLMYHGARFKPEHLPLLLESVFNRRGVMALEKVYFLMEQGAQFDGERLQILRDKEYKINGASENFYFLTEQQLSYLEVEGRYNEAWGLARDTYNRHLLPYSSRLEDTGMLPFYFDLIKQEKSPGVTAEHNRSILSLEVKLEILSQAVNPSSWRYPISSHFRTWLSDAITKDPDPGIAWVILKKGKSEIRVRRDALAYWSEYFERRFSGRWPVPETLVFDSNDEFTTESFIKVFGHFVTTGAYDYKTPEDCYDGLKVARYFLIEKLIEKLEGIIARHHWPSEANLAESTHADDV